MKYTCAIFDLDGTLLDTLQDLADATNDMLRRLSCPLVTSDQVRSYVGDGIRCLIERALPDGEKHVKEEEAFGLFMRYYKEHCNDHTRMYDGVKELLFSLKERGVKMAIVSNKNHVACEQLKEKYFGGLIDVVIGENEAAGIRKKPFSDTVYRALDLLGAKREECVYIGDSEVDVLTAKNAGTDCISVLWGFRDRKKLIDAGASVFVRDAEEILEFFSNNVFSEKEILKNQNFGKKFGKKS